MMGIEIAFKMFRWVLGIELGVSCMLGAIPLAQEDRYLIMDKICMS